MEGTRPSRAITQSQVAREAGVSRGLVSMALAGSPRVARETRDHILATAARLGYRVNRSAAALASGRSGLVGLVLPDLRNPFFDFIAHSLQVAARQEGLTLLITIATGSTEGREVLETLLTMQLEGLILVSPAMPDEAIRELSRETVVCLIGRSSAGGDVDTVRLDEAAAAEVVVEHLRQVGAEELVYLTPPSHEDPNAVERGVALAQAAAQANTVLRTVVASGEGAGLRKVLDDAEANSRLGVVAHNDVVAVDALAALRSARYWTPLVSYDDTYLAQREEFAITSVEQPAKVMASHAIRFICERSGRLGGVGGKVQSAHRGGRSVTLAPVLAVRRSSRS